MSHAIGALWGARGDGDANPCDAAVGSGGAGMVHEVRCGLYAMRVGLVGTTEQHTFTQHDVVRPSISRVPTLRSADSAGTRAE